MDCKFGDVLVNSNYRQGRRFYFSENGLSKVFHDFFFPHIPVYFVFPASVTDGVFLSKSFMFMDIRCLPSNVTLGKTIYHMSLVFLWVPLLKQFSVCRRKEGSMNSRWSFFVFLIFFLFTVACLVAVAVSCSARATLWRLQERRPSQALVSVLLLVGTFLTWKVMSRGKGALRLADWSALAGISVLKDLPGCQKAVQSERLTPQLQLSVLARTGGLSLWREIKWNISPVFKKSKDKDYSKTKKRVTTSPTVLDFLFLCLVYSGTLKFHRFFLGS